MKENLMDVASDILKERLGNAKIEIQKMYKGTNPYRMEKVPDVERIQQYLGWQGTPQEQEFRQQFGDEAVEKIHLDMHELINKKVMKNA